MLTSKRSVPLLTDGTSLVLVWSTGRSLFDTSTKFACYSYWSLPSLCGRLDIPPDIILVREFHR